MGFLSALGKTLSSKSVWGNIGTGILLAGQFLPAIAPYIAPTTPLGAGLSLGAVAFSIYGRIKAKQPLGPVVDDTVAKTANAIAVLHGNPQATNRQVQAITESIKTGKPLIAPPQH